MYIRYIPIQTLMITLLRNVMLTVPKGAWATSQFEPFFGLPRHAFCGMFLNPFKNLVERVLSGLKILGYACQLEKRVTLIKE